MKNEFFVYRSEDFFKFFVSLLLLITTFIRDYETHPRGLQETVGVIGHLNLKLMVFPHTRSSPLNLHYKVKSFEYYSFVITFLSGKVFRQSEV